MTSTSTTTTGRARWAGWAIGGLAMLFLLLDGVGKIARAAPVVETMTNLGYPESSVAPLGWVLVASVLLHALPRTALLGNILCTGYLGGAIATHVRVGSPVPTHLLFPLYLGVALWVGLWLRDESVRKVFPFTRK